MHIPTVSYGYNVQAFSFPFTAHHSPTVGRSQQLRMKNNSKSTIPEDSDEQHYYYGYIIPRQLSYSSHASSLLGATASSTALATDLHLLVAMAE